MVPSFENLMGCMSNTSTPAIFDRISSLSRPVAWSKSVGIDPVGAPDGIRSDASLTCGKFVDLMMAADENGDDGDDGLESSCLVSCL